MRNVPIFDPPRRWPKRRVQALIIAVNCTQAAATCFCTSMGTGPRSKGGFDLALTELYSNDRHVFLIESGSEAGKKVLERLDTDEASAEDITDASDVAVAAEKAITKRLPTEGLRDRILDNLNHPMWNDVGERCLACANCTMACPTC